MSVWQPGPRPEWVRALNEVGRPEWIELDPESMLAEARRNTGLDDFGERSFREGLEVFAIALEREAELHFVGRALARADTVGWLENRLTMTELRKREPEIDAQQVPAPLFITGLPRTGTSILHELLGQDPGARVPLAWEAAHPCPPPERASYASDPRIARAQGEIGLWDQIVPEYRTMHELGAQVPVECIVLMAPSFACDELSGRHQVPSYAAWLARADLRPAYEWHRDTLRVLQWRCPGERWVLKAPSHLARLDSLLDVYPDARIVQTHRDPLRVMGSVASILYATAWLRSDAVDAERVLAWFNGEVCAQMLDSATALRDSGRLRPEQVCDVRYDDLMKDPFGVIARVYAHFDLECGAEAEDRMRTYLEARPKDRHGVHRYDFGDTGLDLDTERRRFAAYQERFCVPGEV